MPWAQLPPPATASSLSSLDGRVADLEAGGTSPSLGRAAAIGDGNNLIFALGVSGASAYKVEVNDADQPLSVGSVVGSDFVFGAGNTPPSGHYVLILFTY